MEYLDLHEEINGTTNWLERVGGMGSDSLMSTLSAKGPSRTVNVDVLATARLPVWWGTMNKSKCQREQGTILRHLAFLFLLYEFQALLLDAQLIQECYIFWMK